MQQLHNKPGVTQHPLWPITQNLFNKQFSYSLMVAGRVGGKCCTTVYWILNVTAELQGVSTRFMTCWAWWRLKAGITSPILQPCEASTKNVWKEMLSPSGYARWRDTMQPFARSWLLCCYALAIHSSLIKEPTQSAVWGFDQWSQRSNVHFLWSVTRGDVTQRN